MNDWTSTVIESAVSVALAIGIAGYLSLWAGAVEHRRRAIEAFFSHAALLIGDPRLPDSRLDRLGHYIDSVYSSSAFWGLFRTVRSDLSKAPNPIDWESMVPENREIYTIAFWHWMIAVSYQKPVLGILVRAQLAELLAAQSRSEAKIEQSISLYRLGDAIAA